MFLLIEVKPKVGQNPPAMFSLCGKAWSNVPVSCWERLFLANGTFVSDFIEGHSASVLGVLYCINL